MLIRTVVFHLFRGKLKTSGIKLNILGFNVPFYPQLIYKMQKQTRSEELERFCAILNYLEILVLSLLLVLFALMFILNK